MRPTTIVNQPPISLIIPDNVSASDPEHKLARVIKATRQCLQPTIKASSTDDVNNESHHTTPPSLIDWVKSLGHDLEDDEPLFATNLSAFGTSLKVYKFSSEHLANLNRFDIIADHHGCTLHDIAHSERTKPLRYSKSRLLSPKQRSTWCEQWQQRREIEREEKHQACEAAWQQELATWPVFVPRNPINTPQSIVCDLSTLHVVQPPKPFVVDYLAEARPKICTHPNLRFFTFNSRETIKMCPDCSTFDKQRIAALKTGSIPKAKLLRWEERLEAEGLPAEPQRNPLVSFHKSVLVDKIEHAQAGDAGQASLAKNNHRARQIRKDLKTNTEATRNCLGCGQSFVPTRKGHEKYCSLNCNKRHNKQMKRRRDGDSRV